MVSCPSFNVATWATTSGTRWRRRSPTLLWFWIQTLLIQNSSCLKIWPVWGVQRDRFCVYHPAVLGWKGFVSGFHSWDVELVVAAESVKRKGDRWEIKFSDGKYEACPPISQLLTLLGKMFHLIGVNLDFDRGCMIVMLTQTHKHSLFKQSDDIWKQLQHMDTVC